MNEMAIETGINSTGFSGKSDWEFYKKNKN